MPLAPRPILAGTLVAFAAACASAVAAAPVVAEPLKSCYVSVAEGRTEPVLLSAGGFDPAALVDVRRDGVSVGTIQAGGDGRLAGRVYAPFQRRGERTFTIELAQQGPPWHAPRLASRVTALAARLDPLAARPQSVVTWTGRGFTDPGPVFVHYVKDGAAHRSVRLGPARPPCGSFRFRRQQFPFQPSRGTWILQIDQQRAYAPMPDSPFVQLPVTLRRTTP